MSVTEVTQLLGKFKCKKAAGYDNLPPGLLKDSTAIISAPLAHIINLSFRSGVFPSDWKMTNILPLHKNGATDQFGNHHPISVLPVISKLIEKIAHNRMVNYLSESKLLSKRQFGFRAKRSTELAVTLSCDDIRKNADSKLLTRCVFIDFSKALNAVSHAKLLQKLNAYEMLNLSGFWITYFNQKQLVNYNNISSESGLMTCGVPQGSILDPLYVIFILF